MNSTRPTLVLASTSPFRKTLLERLGVPFETTSPDVDETALPNESPQALVQRLAEQKARAVADRFPDALIIGSDQVAVLDGEIIGKPGDHADAVRQLRNASGRTVRFLTGLCLFNAASGTARSEVVPFEVTFRQLSGAQIERYLKHEKPYNCAGSFRSEALGIALFEKMRGDDPNTLIGLPLIRLISLLENEGFSIL